jgi:hypothetical protein
MRLQDQFTAPVRAVLQQLQSLRRGIEDINRIAAGTAMSSQFNRLHGQIRGLGGEVRNLASQFRQLGSSIGGAGAGGSFAQRQIADMRTLIGLQQQAIANNARMIVGPAGPSGLRTTGGTGAGGIWGRRGFSPNASLADRFQHRFVGVGGRSLIEGALELDRARTQLLMLSVPRPDPNDPSRTLPGVLTPEAVGRAEALAVELSQVFRVLNRGQILDTFREIATQFQNVEDAFRLLPEMLNMQEWNVLMGDTVTQGRSGMLEILRAIGLSGRLINNNGRLSIVDPNDPNSPIQAAEFIDLFMRARAIGGRDVSASQVFQLMKYMKTTGQTLSTEALLTAFIAMPDIRGSTFGNSLDQLRLQLSGRATQAAQAALEAGGLGTRGERTASGPHMFTPVDAVLLNENPFEWFNRHILGPTGFLRRQGINPLTANAAEISVALRPLFSRATVESIANMIVNQQAEWRAQIQNALRLNLSPESRRFVFQNSGWAQLQAAGSALQDVLGAIVENFKILNPVLESVTDSMKSIAKWIDPRTGSPLASLGILGGAAGLAFLGIRSMFRGMGPWGRTLIGGGAGFLLTGLMGGSGIVNALTGALLGRQLGGSGVAAVAGAAGAAAGLTWGGRFVRAIMGTLRFLRFNLLFAAGIYVLEQVITNWETVKVRLLAIWEDLRQAAPVWLGGEGRGWRAFAQGPAMTRSGQDLDDSLLGMERGVQDWLRGTALGPWLRRGLPDEQLRRMRLAEDYERLVARTGWGFAASPEEAASALRTAQRGGAAPSSATVERWARMLETGRWAPGNVTTGPINVTVNVQTNADPNAIGDAAGSAVRSHLRRLLGDSADTVPYGGP